MMTIAVNGSIPWHSCGVSLAISDHTVLPATRHKWTHPALSPPIPGGMEGWVGLDDLIAPRPGVKPATFRSRVQRSTNVTTKTAKCQQHAGNKQESWAIAKMTTRCAIYMAALKIFGSPRLRPLLLFPTFLMDFCSDNRIDPVNEYECRHLQSCVHAKFVVCSFIVPEIIGDNGNDNGKKRLQISTNQSPTSRLDKDFGLWQLQEHTVLARVSGTLFLPTSLQHLLCSLSENV